LSRGEIERIIDELVEKEVTRRRLLRQAGAGALSLSAVSFLAACGGEGIEGGDKKQEAKAIPKGEIAKQLSFSNWPLYIDVDGKKHPTLDEFEKKFGTRVKYTEEINDNDEFFGKVRQQYAQKSSGGRDLHVVTDWMAARMKRLGYVQKLDHAAIPNVDKNLIPALKSPGFDPKRDYSVPWQTIQAGLIYRRDKVGGDLKSVNDLFDPKFKGKVTMLTEMRDTVGLVMLGMGKDPEKDGKDAILAAIEKIDKASKDGQIRQFTGNEYLKDLPKGDSWVIVGWSGDAVQLEDESKDIKFAQPEEGFMLSTDNMQIPVGAPHAYTAEVYMNYVYEPEVQAKIAAYVNYVTPVAGVKEILEKDDPKLAESQLIFPNEETLSRAKIFRDLKPEDEREVSEAFQKVIGA